MSETQRPNEEELNRVHDTEVKSEEVIPERETQEKDEGLQENSVTERELSRKYAEFLLLEGDVKEKEDELAKHHALLPQLQKSGITDPTFNAKTEDLEKQLTTLRQQYENAKAEAGKLEVTLRGKTESQTSKQDVIVNPEAKDSTESSESEIIEDAELSDNNLRTLSTSIDGLLSVLRKRNNYGLNELISRNSLLQLESTADEIASLSKEKTIDLARLVDVVTTFSNELDKLGYGYSDDRLSEDYQSLRSLRDEIVAVGYDMRNLRNAVEKLENDETHEIAEQLRRAITIIDDKERLVDERLRTLS